VTPVGTLPYIDGTMRPHDKYNVLYLSTAPLAVWFIILRVSSLFPLSSTVALITSNFKKIYYTKATKLAVVNTLSAS